MATTAGGTYYAASTETLSSYPALSLNLANQLESRLAAKAAYPAGGSDGQAIVKSGTSTAWASVAPASGSATVATSQSTSSATYADLATGGPAVTLTTGTKALVIFGAYMYGASTNTAYCSVAVSGATNVSASDSWAVSHDSTTANYGGTRYRAYLFTGLVAGSNTFTLKYRSSSSSATYVDRYIVVMNMGS